MLRKPGRLLTFVIVLALIVAGCGQSADQTDEAQAEDAGEASDTDEKVILKLGHALSPEDVVDHSANHFAELVAEKSNDTMEIQIFPSQQLGNETTMLEQMAIGEQDMGIIVAGAMETALPEMGVFSHIYAFRDIEHAENVMWGEIGKELNEKLLEEKNIRVIHPYWYYGTNHITANAPVENADDLKQLKIRVPEVPIYKAGLDAMGANATPIDFNELYTALSTGVVDGQENAPATIKSAALHEVQDYLILTSHMRTHFLVTMSEAIFEELTEEQQNILLEAAKEAGELHNENQIQAEEDAIEELVELGMEIIEPDTSEFEKAAEELSKEYEDVWGDLYMRIQEVQ